MELKQDMAAMPGMVVWISVFNISTENANGQSHELFRHIN